MKICGLKVNHSRASIYKLCSYMYLKNQTAQWTFNMFKAEIESLCS